MSGYNLLCAMGDIDSDLISGNYKKLRHKKIVSCIAVAIMVLALCAFALVASFSVTREGNTLNIEILNPSSERDYEELSFGYITEGYEVVKNEEDEEMPFWTVTRNNIGFEIRQLPQEVETSLVVGGTSEDADNLFKTVLVLDELSELNAEDLYSTAPIYSSGSIYPAKEIYWYSENCFYIVSIYGDLNKWHAEQVVLMLQSITP